MSIVYGKTSSTCNKGTLCWEILILVWKHISGVSHPWMNRFTLQLLLSSLQFFLILLLLVLTEVTLVLVIHIFHDQVSSLSTRFKFSLIFLYFSFEVLQNNNKKSVSCARPWTGLVGQMRIIETGWDGGKCSVLETTKRSSWKKKKKQSCCSAMYTVRNVKICNDPIVKFEKTH